MSLVNCDECGQMISDKAVACPHCGAPVKIDVNPSEQTASHSTSTLRVIRTGKYPVASVTLIVKSNGMIVGIYPFDVGFDMEIHASPDMELVVRYQGVDTPTRLTLLPKRNYVCKVNYSTTFSYELYEENSILQKEDKLETLMLIICVLIPIVGIIYYFVKKSEYPVKAKNALVISLISIGITFLINLL